MVDLFRQIIRYSIIGEKGCDSLQYDNTIPGKTIRRLRLQKGMSQDLLSGFAGIARTHLSMIECGRKKPNLETIWKIALALEMKPNDLVYEIEQALLQTQEHPSEDETNIQK